MVVINGKVYKRKGGAAKKHKYMGNETDYNSLAHARAYAYHRKGYHGHRMNVAIHRDNSRRSKRLTTLAKFRTLRPSSRLRYDVMGLDSGPGSYGYRNRRGRRHH